MAVLLSVAAFVVFADRANGSRAIFAGHPWRWDGVTFGPLLPAGLFLAVLGIWNAWLARHARTSDGTSRSLAEVLLPLASLGLLLVLYDQLADDNPAYAVLAATAASVALGVAGRHWDEPAFGLWAGATWVLAALYWIGGATIAGRWDAHGTTSAAWTAAAPFANSTFLAALALVGSAWIVAGSIGRSTFVARWDVKVIASIPAVISAYLLLHAMSFEVDRWCQIYAPAHFADPAHAERVALSVLWALLALASVVAGLTFSMRGLRLMGLGLFAITGAKVLLVDMAQVKVLHRVLSAMALGVLSLAGSYAYQRVRRLTVEKQGASQGTLPGRP
jgi:uncharacterized membrane protein